MALCNLNFGDFRVEQMQIQVAGRKVIQKKTASPFEEDKSPEMKVGDEGDASKANSRGLLNGMDRDCKDFKYDGSFAH